MKSSLKKLRGFTKHKNNESSKDKRDFNSYSAQQDDLAQASEDMQDMRNCYDSLLSAAAATANSAYEFSESLREMGACLLEKTALNDDEESGKVLLMLGKVQFELQKLVDSYRSHIFQTITTPSESLLNELRTVEEMKRQCDEKRNVYEYMIAAQREEGRSRSSKGESFSSQQLQAAHEEYDEEATLFVFRLKSLKQGQTRSLLTQAARHHASQLNFFRKGLKSLEGVEPHLKLVTEQQHIEYQFSELEDDDGEDGYDDDGTATNDDGELSFDYGQNDHVHDVISASRNSMEVDQVDLTFPQVSTAEVAQENPDKNYGELPIYSSPKAGSFSAPLFAEKKFDAADRIKQMRPSSSRKFNTYVLPTPVDAKSSIPTGSSNQPSHARNTSLNHNLWHSSPLEPKKHEKDYRDDKLLGRTNLKSQSILKESNINNTAIRLPSPLGDRFSLPQLDPRIADSKKIKRHAFSGPITSKPWSTRPVLSASGPIAPMDHPQLASGVLPRVAVPRSSPPRVSPSASPPPISTPKISELHELPRPPAASTRPLGLIGHSAPLLPRNQDSSATARHSSSSSSAASPLPIPPAVTRSYSIPSSGQKAMALALHMSKQLEPHNPERIEDVSSPPLTPISFANIRPTSINSEDLTRTGQNRGGD